MNSIGLKTKHPSCTRRINRHSGSPPLMFNTLLNSLGFGQLKGGVATMTKGASWLPCFCPLIRGLVQVLFFVVKLEKSNTGREGLEFELMDFFIIYLINSLIKFSFISFSIVSFRTHFFIFPIWRNKYTYLTFIHHICCGASIFCLKFLSILSFFKMNNY